MGLALLDRLAVKHSTAVESQDGPRSLAASRSLIASVCRDLTGLLNTRRATQDFDSAFDEAANSVLTFGVADFTSFNLTNAEDQERVRCSMERAIRQFEPRLASVSVSIDEVRETRPILQFHIDAVLKTGSQREPIGLSASLARDSRRIAVSAR